MTDVTIMGRLTEIKEKGLVITETKSGKIHPVHCRKALVDNIRNIGLGNIIKIRGYLNEDNEVVASKVYIVFGEVEQ